MQHRAVLAFIVIAGLVACADRGGQPNARGGGPGVIRNGLSDSEVAGALAAIQTNEIEQAQLALDRARSPAVHSYADQLANQFTHEGHEQNEMLGRLRLAPRDCALSLQLKGEGINTLRGLWREPGANFDRAFLSSQVSTMDRSLAVVDGLLVPNAQRPELRQKLESTRALLLKRLNETRGLLYALPDTTPQRPVRPRPWRGP